MSELGGRKPPELAGRVDPGGWQPAELAEPAGRVDPGGWQPAELAEPAGRVNTAREPSARGEPASTPAVPPPPETPRAGMLAAASDRLRRGDLGSMPVAVGLVLIAVVFSALNGHFLAPENLTNLALQMAATGTIALGIVLVLLLGEIDLSVGSVSGLAAVV
ncbi:MAG: hypothetical protein J2P19_01635, partial [Pseudonocardia sp.]|nr:hypothetical protein [Pseudonocardia sp.]